MTYEELSQVEELRIELRKVRLRSTLALALITFILLIWLAITTLTTLFPGDLQLRTGAGSAYARLWDGNRTVGVVVNDYGKLELRYIAEDKSRRTVVRLDEDGLKVTLMRGDTKIAQWKVTESGAVFEKLNQ
jgi:hypothetical protein